PRPAARAARAPSARARERLFAPTLAELEPPRVERLLASHPPPAEHIARARQEAAAPRRSTVGGACQPPAPRLRGPPIAASASRTTAPCTVRASSRSPTRRAAWRRR